MKYHNITKDDMLNGDGLRVVLWLSGCSHHCKGCQNPVTWDPEDGEELTMETLSEIEKELRKDYIKGLTLSGGDPLYCKNRSIVEMIVGWFKELYKSKDIWIYTGFTWEEVKELPLMQYVDVLVDGPFIEELADVNYQWAGSTNQRVIDVQKSLCEGGDCIMERKIKNEEKTIMEMIKERGCKHIQSLGNYAVFVDASCPYAHMVRGTLVASKYKCLECEVCKR